MCAFLSRRSREKKPDASQFFNRRRIQCVQLLKRIFFRVYIYSRTYCRKQVFFIDHYLQLSSSNRINRRFYPQPSFVRKAVVVHTRCLPFTKRARKVQHSYHYSIFIRLANLRSSSAKEARLRRSPCARSTPVEIFTPPAGFECRLVYLLHRTFFLVEFRRSKFESAILAQTGDHRRAVGSRVTPYR